MRNTAFPLKLLVMFLPFLLGSNAYAQGGFYVLVEKAGDKWKTLTVSKENVNRKNPKQEVMFVGESLDWVQPAFLGTKSMLPEKYSKMCSYSESEDKRGYSACNSNLMKFNSVVSGIDKFTNMVGLGVADKDHKYTKYLDVDAVSGLVAQSNMMALVKQFAAEERVRLKDEQEKLEIALAENERLDREREVQRKLKAEEKENREKAKAISEIHQAYPLLLTDKQGFERRLNHIAVAHQLEFRAEAEGADPHVALKRFTSLAAVQNEYEALYEVGMLFYEGTVVKQDYEQAFRWCSDAANRGCANAEAQIGYMYSKGEGVKRNMVEAAKWLRSAEAKGYESAPPKKDFVSVKACIETALAKDVNYPHFEGMIKSVIDAEIVIKDKMDIFTRRDVDSSSRLMAVNTFFEDYPGSNMDLPSGTGLFKDRGVSYKFSSGKVHAANYTGENGLTYEMSDLDGAGITLKNKVNGNYLKFRYEVCAGNKVGLVDIYYEDLVRSVASQCNKNVRYADLVSALNRYYKESYQPKGKSLWQLAEALLLSGVERDSIATEVAKIMQGKSSKKPKS